MTITESFASIQATNEAMIANNEKMIKNNQDLIELIELSNKATRDFNAELESLLTQLEK